VVLTSKNPRRTLRGMKKPKVTPDGKCWCGCNVPTKEGSFFHAGHDKRAESMLTRLKFGPENAIAHRLADAGYGPGGKNLLAEYQRAESADHLAFFAIQSLNDMSSKPGIAEAVVFTAPDGVPSMPNPTPGGDPQPKKTSILEVPQRGSVVAQGFPRPLSQSEKDVVQARFPGRQVMWLANS